MAKKPPPGGLTVVPETATIKIGVTQFVFCSEPRALWSSSNPAIALVDDVVKGAVLGVSAGTAAILAKYRNKKGTMTITVEAPPVPPVDLPAYGPRTDVTQPSGSVIVLPGPATIQAAAAAWPTGTTFWLTAGLYGLTAPIVPKSGQRFVGEYGAILDGAGWATTDPDAAAFRALNLDVDGVTIHNLTIRAMPQKAIMAYRDFSSGWTIESNEIASNLFGLEFCPSSRILRNYIHHNAGDIGNPDPSRRGGGYIGNRADDSLMEANEIAFNGPEQKLIDTARMIVRDNYVHDHASDGIWIDGDLLGGGGTLIEGNRVEDNGRDGIVMENVRGGGIIRNNTLRRNAEAILLADAWGFDVSENTLQANTISLSLFKDLDSDRDLVNNLIHHNAVTVPGVGGGGGGIYAGVLQITGSGNRTPWISNAKNNVFASNTYTLGGLTDAVWTWAGGRLDFSAWQAIPQDAGGTVGL